MSQSIRACPRYSWAVLGVTTPSLLAVVSPIHRFSKSCSLIPRQPTPDEPQFHSWIQRFQVILWCTVQRISMLNIFKNYKHVFAYYSKIAQEYKGPIGVWPVIFLFVLMLLWMQIRRGKCCRDLSFEDSQWPLLQSSQSEHCCPLLIRRAKQKPP